MKCKLLPLHRIIRMIRQYGYLLYCQFLFVFLSVLQFLLLTSTSCIYGHRFKSIVLFVNSTREVMFSPCWLICLQDYTKTTKKLPKKLGLRMDLGPE